ncbi:DNA internalization-related competence protein ComEC/Rec2 [Thioflavicoccus mobilis]|uniref:DNA internalization-related competence protein ComEC/Rec2 n=1 Tax=Thioflavicoccus mobilis TaxID=80679 RepID=UPI0002F12744|nr:DNA internalization-related competence protein ComEC/Rec2 [Thioflavicoccus mobilis]
MEISRPPHAARFIPSALAFAAGVVLFYGQPTPAPLAISLLVALLVGLAAWRWARARPLAFLALGLLYAHLQSCDLLCRPFPDELSRVDLVVEGTIVSLPNETGIGRRFEFRIATAGLDGTPADFAGRVRLSWYRDAPSLHVGERWRLKVRLVPRHGFANPGGFDYERWLFMRGIKATGYVRDDPANRRLAPSGPAFALARWRERLRDHLAAHLADPTARSLAQALVLGERDGLRPPQWEVLTRTGTNHLLAISGLHIGMVAGAAFLVGRWLWARSAHLCLWLAAPRAAAGMAAGAAFGYGLLAGLAVPTQRAMAMLAVVLAALIWGRTLRPFAALALALVAVLLIDPRAVLSYGFWLSFGAVAVLLFALGQRPAPIKTWLRWGRAQWAVALGLAPLLLFFFGRASLVAPAVNLIAVPLLGLLLPALLVATLLSLLPALGLPLVLVGELLSWCYGLLERLAEHPWATATLAGRPGWVWAAAVGGVLLWLAPRGLPGRWLAPIWLLPLVLVHPPTPPNGTAWVTVLDVGQGLSVVVRTARHTLVYDTGPAFPSGFNAGSAAVLPFLRQAGIARIDTLVVSNADNDHAGGLPGLVGALPIGRVLSGEPDELAELRAEPCRAGQRWRWDGVAFAVLHPDGPGPRGNDASCVLRIAGGGTGLLLTGDIGAGVEERLVERLGRDLQSDLLVASHHGSATSSSAAFLAAVAPRDVIYSSGFANRYGFPADTVRARVATTGATELDTARAGAIAFRLGGEVGLIGPRLQRRDAARLWTHRPTPLARLHRENPSAPR